MSDIEMIHCPACGADNRVPLAKIEQGRAPVCGRCKAPLHRGGKPVTVTDATFAAEVEQSPVPVVVDMWAPWCGPCRIIGPPNGLFRLFRVGRGTRLRRPRVTGDHGQRTAKRGARLPWHLQPCFPQVRHPSAPPF